MARKRSTTPTRKKQVAALARLRKIGVTKARAKTGKALSGAARSALKKYAPVLEGRAKAVPATSEIIRRYRTTFTTGKGHIVVPVRAGERVKPLGPYNVIRKTRRMTAGGRRYEQMVPPRLQSLTDLPQGRNVAYGVHMGKQTQYFATFALLDQFINEYQGFQYNIGRIEIVDRRALEAEDD